MLKRYEYFLETTESISGGDWVETLNKHGNQGWELSSILLNDMKRDFPTNDVMKNEEARSIKIIFKREY